MADVGIGTCGQARIAESRSIQSMLLTCAVDIWLVASASEFRPLSPTRAAQSAITWNLVARCCVGCQAYGVQHEQRNAEGRSPAGDRLEKHQTDGRALERSGRKRTAAQRTPARFGKMAGDQHALDDRRTGGVCLSLPRRWPQGILFQRPTTSTFAARNNAALPF
jgi:hypothetical protein